MSAKKESLRKCMGILLVILCVVGLFACGGGGDGSPGGSFSGRVIQGPVSGAFVFADHNDGSAEANGIHDVGETSTTTDASGNFTYPALPGYAYISRSTGGIDTTTNKPALPMASPQGTTTISPITTMVALTPPAQQAALISKIETIMGGSSYASNPAEKATPAALALTKAIEASMTAVGASVQQAATSGGGAAIPDAQINLIQTQVATAIAAELVKPATTTATLSNAAGLATSMGTAAQAAVVTINATANTNVVFSDTAAISTAVNTAVNTVTTAVATETGGAGGVLATTAASAVPEASVVQPIANTIDAAASEAAASTSQTVAAVVVVAGDTTRPTVTAVSPADLSAGIPLKASVVIALSKEMNPALITGAAFFLKDPGGNAVPATIAYDSAGKSAVLAPTSPLAASTLYTATFTTAALDLSAKLGLAADKTWSFTTAAASDLTPPTLSSVTPANGAVNVPINAQIVAAFSRQIDASTLTKTNFTIIPDGGTALRGAIHIAAGARQATIIPALPLAYNTSYTVTLSAGIKSLEGAALALTTVTFTTVAPADTAKPTVTSLNTNPAADNTGRVPVGAVVVAKFSEALDITTINKLNFTLNNAATQAVVPGTVAYNAVTRTATFTPASALAEGATYAVAVTTAIKDIVGNPLDKTYNATFTTTQPITGGTGSGGSSGMF